MTVPKTSVLVLDCAEPEALAGFYASLLGARTAPAEGDPDLLLVAGPSGALLGIRRDPDRVPPSWPLPDGPEQPHLRILVTPDALDEAEREAVALGARPLAAETTAADPASRTTHRRYADPAGHAFVLAATGLTANGAPAR
ncbi:VOC family protein [Streptomyces katrae]|uniref:Extradiol dioxygenase n=1 Tax=Streptomyces katrae TaxID=68223 RepID=A0A0F4JNH3_9ACTN|nr:VOC family protein [Streptomyces katrae]KJY34461.1 extradiol dioxygenase [Streptomyces katrae]